MIEQPLEAESLFRKAIELQPEYPGPYCSLGVILILKLQKVREGVEMFKKGHELGSTQPNWTLTNDERIAWAERHLKFAVMLEEYQRIREPPSESPVIFQLAEFAQFRMLDYRSAYELYQAGLEDTSIPVTLRAKFEYNAALVALSCATASEVEEETNQLQQEERDNLRSKALKWLNDSLAGCELMLQEGTDIPTLIDLLRQWNSAPELTSVSGTFIAQLPETEQSGWKELWSSHKALLELALGN